MINVSPQQLLPEALENAVGFYRFVTWAQFLRPRAIVGWRGLYLIVLTVPVHKVADAGLDLGGGFETNLAY